MRTLPSALTDRLAGFNELPFLVSIETATPIRRALWSVDIAFDGATYYAESGAFSEVRTGLDLERPGIDLTLQNVKDSADDPIVSASVARPWSTYLKTNDLNKTEVKLRVVDETVLSDPTAVVLEERWFISGTPRLNKDVVRFRLSSPHDTIVLEVPSKPLGGRLCAWRYKQGPCSSESVKPTCPKTLNACIERFPSAATLPLGPSFPLITKATRRRR